MSEISTNPWRRWFARVFDYLFFILLLQVFTRITPFKLTSLHPNFFVITLFCWVFIETVLIHLMGTTPGKWLLSMQVADHEGKLLSWRDSLNRSLSVWWLGMGAGLPLVCLVTMIVAAVKLSNNGVTSWDKREAYQVQRGKLHPLKIVLYILTLLCYSWFVSFNVNYVLSFF